jgi:hypothetical protein
MKISRHSFFRRISLLRNLCVAAGLLVGQTSLSSDVSRRSHAAKLEKPSQTEVLLEIWAFSKDQLTQAIKQGDLPWAERSGLELAVQYYTFAHTFIRVCANSGTNLSCKDYQGVLESADGVPASLDRSKGGVLRIEETTPETSDREFKQRGFARVLEPIRLMLNRDMSAAEITGRITALENDVNAGKVPYRIDLDEKRGGSITSNTVTRTIADVLDARLPDTGRPLDVASFDASYAFRIKLPGLENRLAIK